MLTLSSKVVIGSFTFDGIHDIKIKRSVHQPGATASIKVPVGAVLRQEGLPPTRTEVAQTVSVNDKVEIWLGYDGILDLEFSGYVRMLNLHTPLEIVCEDEFYATRRRPVKLEGPNTLEGILRACGLDIAMAQTLTIDNFPSDDSPASWVLGKLKSDYGLSVFFDTAGKVYAVDPHRVEGGEVVYRLRENVINDKDLLYHTADDRKTKIKAVGIDKQGMELEIDPVGPVDGTEKKMYFYDIGSAEELKALAQIEADRLNSEGYTGKIETFLWPNAMPTMKAIVEDPDFPERNGTYYIESVEVKYGRAGARRTVEIGRRIS